MKFKKFFPKEYKYFGKLRYFRFESSQWENKDHLNFNFTVKLNHSNNKQIFMQFTINKLNLVFMKRVTKVVREFQYIEK